jgi:hypothetical protein
MIVQIGKMFLDKVMQVTEIEQLEQAKTRNRGTFISHDTSRCICGNFEELLLPLAHRELCRLYEQLAGNPDGGSP